MAFRYQYRCKGCGRNCDTNSTMVLSNQLCWKCRQPEPIKTISAKKQNQAVYKGNR